MVDFWAQPEKSERARLSRPVCQQTALVQEPHHAQAQANQCSLSTVYEPRVFLTVSLYRNQQPNMYYRQTRSFGNAWRRADPMVGYTTSSAATTLLHYPISVVYASRRILRARWFEFISRFINFYNIFFSRQYMHMPRARMGILLAYP